VIQHRDPAGLPVRLDQCTQNRIRRMALERSRCRSATTYSPLPNGLMPRKPCTDLADERKGQHGLAHGLAGDGGAP